MKFSSSRTFKHGEVPSIGILLANLGTPDAPDKASLKRYLAEFLSDPRVIELPKWKWWPILNLIVLQTRPAKSAELYKEIWTEEGSPLLVFAESQKEKLETRLKAKLESPVYVEIGMRYGNPGIREGMEKLRDKGVRKLLVVPLYPQYSATSTASVYDLVFDVLKSWRVVPELRALMSYNDHPLFVEALANSIKESWKDREQPEKLIFSYHGIPSRYFEGGDPYHCNCHKTTRLVVEKLGLKEDQYLTTFQSIFGREEWLKPATDKTIEGLAKDGLKRLDVICPGFSCDCLETLEEIEGENREIFEEHGGETFNYIPCLNDSEGFIDCLEQLTISNISDWLPESLKDLEQNSKACDENYQKLLKKDFQSIRY
jgi:ferrochelatase